MTSVTEPALHLRSMCLFSKWGCNDGDVPDSYLDWCDDHEIPYPDSGEYGWHEVLHGLVTTMLLPVLTAEVTVEFISTIHNPVRATTVNGAPVLWKEGDAKSAHTFAEVTVSIPFTALSARI